MIGKKVKITNGLFKGQVGKVSSKFMYNGQEIFVVKLTRQFAAGEWTNTFATAKLNELITE